MTKCKPRLSLYKRKKYKQQIPATKRFQTPEKSHDKRARFVSPISASHSLKRRLNSPFRSSSLKKSPSSSTRKFRRIYSPVTSDQWQDIEVETLDADIDEDYKLLQTFKSELSKANIWENFSLFFNLVSANSFPLDNLSFILFLDTVAFYSCKTTTQMVYLPQTKRFWKTGYRLFHANFLYYMGGPKNINHNEDKQKGYINPENARINLAVPSVNTLEEFNINDVALPKKMPTGIIEPILEAIADSVSDKRFMLCGDAKKVTAGVDKVGGDVDMFGYEDGKSLSERKERLRSELELLDSIVTNVSETKETITSNVLDQLRESCTVIGKRIQDSREMKCRQEFGLKQINMEQMGVDVVPHGYGIGSTALLVQYNDLL